MAGKRKDAIDTVIANIFRYVLLFGLTAVLYDTKKHRLVHSRAAHCYSLLLHTVMVILFPILYKSRLQPSIYDQTENHLFDILFLVLFGCTFLSAIVSMVLQWMSRAKAPALFNEILQMWNEDMTHLRRSNAVRRQACRVFSLKTLSCTLVVVNATVLTFTNTGRRYSTSQSFYLYAMINVIVAVGFQFCCGLAFSVYLFRILNYNLAQVVQDMHSLCYARRPRHAFQHKAETLEKELSEIGRLHAQLQTWVVRFKNMFQVEVMLVMATYFVLQVFMLFVLCVLLFEGWIDELRSQVYVASATILLGGFDITVTFHICGQVLSACDSAREIMKDLPARRLSCTQLERCVEVTCFKFNADKLRLRICGLADLDWSNGFALTEAAFMYIILLIQLDFKNFQK